MIIGTKLPPEHTDVTYFNLGRSAFAYLVGFVARPKKVYLPTFTCWSLVSTMVRRFPKIEMAFYTVRKDLTPEYPVGIEKDELLVFIHYFGQENRSVLPPSSGCILEDVSHALASKIAFRGDYVFGSLRKMLKVGDGGFIQAYHNPIYEPSSKLDTWLRYEAADWRDMREAENMIDRKWEMADISSQSLAVALTSNLDLVRLKRQRNERLLTESLHVGRPLLAYRDHEGPLLHNRVFDSKEERDSLRAFLAGKGVFTSIHWPTHERVKESRANIDDTLWIADHILCFPVSQYYGANDMEYVATCVEEWHRRG
ncbi:MAG TPA: hypothetical protein VMH22_15025 [bacterium]|nr:hypothetical protein [bacterium]